MDLYKIKRNNLEPVERESFKLEKDIQSLVRSICVTSCISRFYNWSSWISTKDNKYADAMSRIDRDYLIYDIQRKYNLINYNADEILDIGYKCQICGNVARACSSYGGRACHSCRAFFKRSVKNDTFKYFTCDLQKLIMKYYANLIRLTKIWVCFLIQEQSYVKILLMNRKRKCLIFNINYNIIIIYS